MRQFGPFLASEGHDSRLPKVHQPLQVVARGHHRHREARARLADRADHLSAHLLDGGEHVLDACTGLGDTVIASLLALGQRLVALALALDLVPKAVLLQPGFSLLGRIAAISIDVPLVLLESKTLSKCRLSCVLAVSVPILRMNLYFLSTLTESLTPKWLLPCFLVQVASRSFWRRFAGRHEAGIAPLSITSFIASAVVLLRRRHQRGVDDLAAACDEALLQQLRGHAIEQRLRASFADSVLEGPDRGAVRNIDRLAQTAKALVAHSVEQLDLLIRQVVQPLQHQNPHHRFGRKRRPTSLCTHRPRGNPIDFRRQRRKVNVRRDLDQRIAETVNLQAVMLRCEHVVLNGTALFHRIQGQQSSGRRNFTKSGRAEALRGALKSKALPCDELLSAQMTGTLLGRKIDFVQLLANCFCNYL